MCLPAIDAFDSGTLRVVALDAAMPFDFEHRARQQMEEANRLKIGIVGFGTFGQFLAKRMVQAGHTVRLHLLRMHTCMCAWRPVGRIEPVVEPSVCLSYSIAPGLTLTALPLQFYIARRTAC
jgi:hypothetical protein